MPEAIAKYPVTTQVKSKIEKICRYHPPKPDQIPRYELIRSEIEKLMALVAEITPNSVEQSWSLSYLEHAMFYANAAIARNE